MGDIHSPNPFQRSLYQGERSAEFMRYVGKEYQFVIRKLFLNLYFVMEPVEVSRDPVSKEESSC